ncbi:hypothetical protein, partial [Stenotrophomonas lactitubi]|uniref:hypothetical protein n=1 Tax=Stenotrophomonas lactitubi TaxID=2045214 RepID=UPI00203CEB8C
MDRAQHISGYRLSAVDEARSPASCVAIAAIMAHELLNALLATVSLPSQRSSLAFNFQKIFTVSSTRRRNGLAQLSGWRLEAQGLTRSFVETSGDLVQECLRMA